jgi:hypothetical protein
LTSLTNNGCSEGPCYSLIELDIPFEFSSCASRQDQACMAWKWLHCAFPDDRMSGGTVIAHSYFFVQSKFEGEGFAFAQKDTRALLTSSGIMTKSCAEAYPEQARVANALMKDGAEKGIVLFGWDGCPCTGIAQARFGAASLCLAQLTWQDPRSELMKYLQCKEDDSSHHSFVYVRDATGSWKFRGSGFAFDANALSDNALDTLVDEGSVAKGCQNEFSVNIYGETISECRAASTDSRGSWMWDGKCTERGGGVHQICMSQLPADFSVKTGQGPWSEGRAQQRHCVCIGAWSLYMTRESDPAWTTSNAWPFCDAVPMSALTPQYISKWKDWNGIPARIVVGTTKLVEKCLMHRNGPGSEKPSKELSCRLLNSFRALQDAEGSDLSAVNASQFEADHGLDCVYDASKASAVAISSGGSSTNSLRTGGSGGGLMDRTSVSMPSSTQDGDAASQLAADPSASLANPKRICSAIAWSYLFGALV